MDFYVTLILLFLGFNLNSCSHFPLRKYYYIDLKVTWFKAQHYCREKYTDLATIEGMDDINRLKSDFTYSWAWIGLRDDPKSWKGVMGNDTNSWRWSTTGETSKSGYQNWRVNEPNSKSANENCVDMGYGGNWSDSYCQKLQGFVCYTATSQGGKTYVFVSALKTWNSAQAYCREHHTDLAMIENIAENNVVYSMKPANATVWIGLYRTPWTWSDKTQSSFRSWIPPRPNNYGGNQFCMTESSKHEWDDGNCNNKYIFICHQVLRLKTMLRMKIETDADITDPTTKAQILQQFGAVLTSQGWTDFSLQWNIQPRKQEKNEKLAEPQCI